MDVPAPVDPRRELFAELRLARVCILAVALLQVVSDQLTVHTAGQEAWVVNLVSIFDTAMLVVFVGLFFLAVWRPVLAANLALGAFWAMHIGVGLYSTEMLTQGLILKALDTVVLIKAVTSARRAEKIAFSLADQKAARPAT